MSKRKPLKTTHIIFKNTYMGRRNGGLYGRNCRCVNVNMRNTGKKQRARTSALLHGRA